MLAEVHIELDAAIPLVYAKSLNLFLRGFAYTGVEYVLAQAFQSSLSSDGQDHTVL